MRIWPIFLAIPLMPIAPPAYADGNCADVPTPVRAYLVAHTDWRLRVLGDLDKDAQAGWRKYNKDSCPGMETVDLDGRGVVYALLLARRANDDHTQKVVIVGQQGLETLLGPSFVSPVPQVLIRIKSGKYVDQYDRRHIMLKHDGIVIAEWEAGATAYYLSGGRLRTFVYSE